MCLVASSPFDPAGGVAGRFRPVERCGEQPPDLADSERDQPGVSGRRVVWPGRRWRLCAGPVSEAGGCDRADRQGGHDQHDMAEDRGVEPGLALVQAEAALGELEALLNRPPLILL